jgi:hypothetical protein
LICILGLITKTNQIFTGNIKSGFYLGPISLEEDFNDNLYFGISGGVLGVDFKYNSRTSNFGVKVFVGPSLHKFGIGTVHLLDVKGGAYFEIDLDGYDYGLEAKGKLTSDLSVGSSVKPSGKLSLKSLFFEN